jgi:membrane protein DedA with SNARE-associated domain
LSFRFIYGVRNFASFAMGMSGLSPTRFASLNLGAAFVWALCFSGFGFMFGQLFKHMLGDMAQMFSFVTLGIFVAAVALAGYLRRRRRPSPPPSSANTQPSGSD